MLEKQLSKFALDGEILSVVPFGNGHINKTYKVETTGGKYVFQFVNASIFPNVDGLMRNIELVGNHIREKGGRSLEIVKTHDGKLFLKEGAEFFRGYRFIEDSVCYEALPNLEMVREAAMGFGSFHQALSDLDASQIVDVIPDFHNTKKRYEAFLEAVQDDPEGRLINCKEEVDFLLSRKEDYSVMVDALKQKKINNTVTHNDPKINNVAFDAVSGKVKCVLDLDTVMQGTFLYDFGDGLRSLFTGDNEDNKDTSALKADLAIYEAYLDGYYSMMKDVINEEERNLLPFSIQLLAEELSMRFLGDYLLGDVYFGVSYPEHNLIRARTQIALAKDIIAHMDELKEITEKIARKYR